MARERPGHDAARPFSESFGASVDAALALLVRAALGHVLVVLRDIGVELVALGEFRLLGRRLAIRVRLRLRIVALRRTRAIARTGRITRRHVAPLTSGTSASLRRSG